MSSRYRIALILLLVALAARPLRATNGHLLHGVGAIHSALGGAGLALPNDAMSALTANPALLVELPGSCYQFGAELLRADNSVDSRIGPFAGRTEESGDEPVIPAFAWARHAEGSRFAVGMGFLGRAGFGVDYPQDAGNPILAPQPFGFGRVHSNYQHLDIPFAVAWKVGPRTSLGASLNVARATLSAQPAGFASPDCSPGGACFFPTAAADSAFGVGVRVGALWRLGDRLSVAAAYGSEQTFEDFEWNSAVANPALPSFGAGRSFSLAISSPQSVAIGVALRPSAGLALALDAKWLDYSSTEGFGEVLGWQDINALALGVQWEATAGLVLRGGLNHGGNPIPDSASMLNVTSPAILQDHVAVGLGWRVSPGAWVDVAYYHAFENEIRGPLLGPSGPVPGTSVGNSFSLDSLVLTFRFGSRERG
jgi:long-chain fatty acid transport protein